MKIIMTVKGLARLLKRPCLHHLNIALPKGLKSLATDIWDKDQDFIKDPQWKNFSKEEIKTIILNAGDVFKKKAAGVEREYVYYEDFKRKIEEAHRDLNTADVKVVDEEVIDKIDNRYVHTILSLREERDKYRKKYMMIKKHYKQVLRILEETEI